MRHRRRDRRRAPRARCRGRRCRRSTRGPSTTGQLFVPIVAERDGHDFIDDGRRVGGRGGVPHRAAPVDVDATADRRGRHRDGAAGARSSRAVARLPDRVIGITGSVGKTTVKDLTRAASGRDATPPHANERSFNNELGVPLTLAQRARRHRSRSSSRWARAGVGHIAVLCDDRPRRPSAWSPPSSSAHTELFGYHRRGRRAPRASWSRRCRPTGSAVLNADRSAGRRDGAAHDAPASLHVRRRRPRARTSPPRRVDGGRRAAGRRSSCARRGAAREVRCRSRACTRWATRWPRRRSRSRPACRSTMSRVGLAAATLSPWRMELRRAPSGAVVINDAYNANPASMEAALRSLAGAAGAAADRGARRHGRAGRRRPGRTRAHRARSPASWAST